MEDDGTGTMVPVLLLMTIGVVIFWFSLQSEITCTVPAGDYYIVVSGYGTSEGDYELSVRNLDENSCMWVMCLQRRCNGWND